MEKVVLLGAAGKMGMRLARNLRNSKNYDTLYIETSPEGVKRLADVGLSVSAFADAIPQADYVIMALPDRFINTVATDMLPLLKTGAMVMMLDPAAAFAGKLPTKDGVDYFVTHPYHTAFINDETDPNAKSDYFGGDYAKQNIVCALFKGDEAQYGRGEALAKTVFGKVVNAYRVTVEQMAILEPGLAETVCATLLYGLRAALDRVVEMGVPAEAAKAFLMGHMLGESVVVFDYVDYNMSDACLEAVRLATPEIFQPGWLDKIFTLEAIRKSACDITV
ncbi:MAG: NAD(P)-binding domain-containing protein [Planctomycetaceae bacterium]|nr:NAD(P)-binding domain-containing protein [Planctomycetaceae bacterium]